MKSKRNPAKQTRPLRHDITVVGGPNDGLRLVLVDRPNGESYIDAGLVFFPDGVEDYVLDREAWTLTYTDEP